MRLRFAALFAALLVVGSAPLTAQSKAKPRSDPAVLTVNPYLGTAISPYDARVSPYSPYGARNKYTTDGGKVFGADDQYLGTLNANKYDLNSIANPYGQYGSKYSPTSINNPYSEYGSKYSPKSAKNPYATTPPKVVYPNP